jgi:hypothetical protein
MILPLALLAITFADNPPAVPDFVEFQIREGIADDDRRMIESILKQRRRTFDRLAAQVEELEAVIPRIKSGSVRPGVNPFQKPAADAKGDWYFANKEMKAATASAYGTRLRVLRLRLKNYAVNPAFTTPFAGRPEIGTIGYLPQPASVVHVVSDIEVLLDGGRTGKLWIEGIDARDIADNQPLSLPWAFYVAGTTSYLDGYGAKRTVPRLRRFDVGPFLE